MSTGPDLFVICKKCGSEVSPYVTECPYCGTRLRKRAPKLDREGRPTEPLTSRRAKARAAKKARKEKPGLGRLRRGEMPGVRGETRPYATAALLVAAIVTTLAESAGAFPIQDVAIILERDDPWRYLTAAFAYNNFGHELTALIAIALFGWLLERRHGPIVVLVVALASAAAGMALVVAVDPSPIALGGHGMGLGLLAAWAIPDLLARRRGEEVDADLLGVAVIALVLLLTPLAVEDANALAGVGGGLAGLLLGLPLARFAR